MTKPQTIKAQAIKPMAARWNPNARRDMALIRIERAIVHALKDPRVKFRKSDKERVLQLLSGAPVSEFIPEEY